MPVVGDDGAVTDPDLEPRAAGEGSDPVPTHQPEAPSYQPDAPTLHPEAGRNAPSGPGFLPNRPGRAGAESVLVRLIATAGVVGIGTAVGAGLSATSLAGWIVALVVSALSVILAAVLWRSRRL